MPILIDATVLSNLAVVDRLDLLGSFGDTIYMVPVVYEEIRRGIEEGYEFLDRVNEALDAGLVHLAGPENDAEWRRFREMPGKLHLGEAMSLAIASQRGWRFLTDDRAARIHARRLGISYAGTFGLLGYAIQRGQLTIEEGNSLLDKMITRARYRPPANDLRILFEE
jgi:predicted nucleic acid-binding protein